MDHEESYSPRLATNLVTGSYVSMVLLPSACWIWASVMALLVSKVTRSSKVQYWSYRSYRTR